MKSRAQYANEILFRKAVALRNSRLYSLSMIAWAILYISSLTHRYMKREIIEYSM